MSRIAALVERLKKQPVATRRDRTGGRLREGACEDVLRQAQPPLEIIARKGTARRTG